MVYNRQELDVGILSVRERGQSITPLGRGRDAEVVLGTGGWTPNYSNGLHLLFLGSQPDITCCAVIQCTYDKASIWYLGPLLYTWLNGGSLSNYASRRLSTEPGNRNARL